MEIVIDRLWKKDAYTIGRLYVDGRLEGNSLEDKDRGLTQDMPLAEIKKRKVMGKTAIPAGRYRVAFTYSPRFNASVYAHNGMIPLLLNVPGFEAIRLHSGANAEHTEGCPLLGKNTVIGGLTQSKEVCTRVFDSMYKAWGKGDAIWITIK